MSNQFRKNSERFATFSKETGPKKQEKLQQTVLTGSLFQQPEQNYLQLLAFCKSRTQKYGVRSFKNPKDLCFLMKNRQNIILTVEILIVFRY